MTGVHPNAVSGSVQVTGSGSAVTEGRSAARTHEHQQGRLVVDSPPCEIRFCQMTRKDGTPCTAKLVPGPQYRSGICLPHSKMLKGRADAEK